MNYFLKQKAAFKMFANHFKQKELACSDFSLTEKSLLWKGFCRLLRGQFWKTCINMYTARNWSQGGCLVLEAALGVDISQRKFPFVVLAKSQFSSVST